MNIKCIITGPVDVNTYIVWNDDSHDSFVIDPSDAGLVLDFLAENKLTCTHILLTHGHFDHVIANAEIKEATACKVCIHESEEECTISDKKNLGLYTGISVLPCTADILLHDGDTLNICGTTIKVLHTPGHSCGSVCYILDNERVIFSGDTLFRLSVGRTDLPTASTQELEHSIINRLYLQRGDYRVLPGHGRETTLEFERMHNPYTLKMNP